MDKYENIMESLNTIMPYYNPTTGEARIGVINSLSKKSSTFSIIAIRCDEESCTGRKNLKVGKIYQLLSGYTINDDIITEEEWRSIQNVIYDDFVDDKTYDIPHVQFSAIVGKNGSGKSSLVELFMRIVNNFATSLFGEINPDTANERLHYVKGVSGSIWFALENSIYMLKVSQNVVSLNKYKKNSNDVYPIQYIKEKNPVFDISLTTSNATIAHTIGDNKDIKNILEHFFYSLIANYSLHAYNTNDFILECIPTEKKEYLYGDEKFNVEDDNWLHSWFHKNDGYKTPMCIIPYRNEGIIDINNENELAKERLISLMIMHQDYRVINDHLQAEELEINIKELPSYGFGYLTNKLKLTKLKENDYIELKNHIISSWEECIGCDFSKYTNKHLYDNAINYIVYKTIKVSKQYEEHNELYELLCDGNNLITESMVQELVIGEFNDHSHITRKIFQTIAYLIYNVYNLTPQKQNANIYLKFEEINWRAAFKNIDIYRDSTKIPIILSAIIPPPFCESEIRLYSNEHSDIVKFNMLSSGERQQLFTISSILYHLDNINSVKDDNFNKERIFYPHVNIILEEIELYFHPEMQRTFVRKLLEGIHAIRLEHLKSVNFILVTHSPYVLSDIPRSNILALEDDACIVRSDKLKTFGANVHDILRTSFFLDNGTMGAYAQWMVKHISACLHIHKWAQTRDVDFTEYHKCKKNEAFDFMERYTSSKTIGKEIEKYFEYEKFKEDLGARQIKLLIDLIDEPVLHNALIRQFNDTFGVDIVTKEQRRQELLKQLKELDEDDSI